MAAEERWYFTKQQLSDTPNRKCGIDPDKELSYRQQAANFIQDMGQRLQVNQLCINTAIVYMHRFYMFHTFNKFHRNAISTCALFLAAKVEEQPRKLEHVIKVAHLCLHREAPPLDAKSEAYLEQAQELVINENIMLQTLGFDVAIDHPHTHVVKCCQLVRGNSTSIHQHHVSKDLAQTSYFMATNSLHLTTMCLQYKPTVVACVCIHLACKWGSWEIPRSREGRKWFYYVDKTVTEELLEELTSEFLAILDRCPSRLKRRMMSANTAGTNEFSDMNCSEALAQTALPLGKAGASSMSLTLSTPISTLKGEKSSSEKYHDRERDRASASTSKSGLKTTPSATVSSAEKNGTPGGGAPERKDRVKKEHISSSSSSAGGLTVAPPQLTSVLASSSELTQQAVPTVATSPVTSISGKSDLVKIANCMDNVQLSLPSSDTSLSTPKKPRADGTSRTMTPKEYHEYKERSKREKEKMKQPLVALAEHGRIQAAKQGKTDDGWEKGMIQELTLNNTPLSSINLQPVVSLTLLNLAKLKNAKHSQLSAGSSAAKPFMKAAVDGIHNGTDDTSSSLAQGFGQIAVNARQSPEHEGRDANSGVAKITSVNMAGDSGGGGSSHPALTGFPIVPILTPSPPTTKDGDPFSMDEEMPVFASPSVFLVPVAPAEVEPVQPAAVPVVEPIKVGVVKSESRKQRKDEPPAFIDTNNEFKPQLNSTFPTSEHRKREKVNSKMTDVISDVPQIGIDSHQTSRRPHNVKNSSDKPSKHHRVKKSQSASLTIKSECHGDDGGFLPQQDFNVLVPDHVNVNPTVVSAKLSEINTEISRIANATHSQSTTSSTEIIQQPGLNFVSAPIVPEPANETKINRNFQETRHSSQQKGNTLPPPIPEEIINTNEKHVADSEVPPVQTVKTENETKHSKRSVQSSSSSSSAKHKEKRKKHDRKEKPKEHSRDKGEEKLVPKFKLTIPKDALSTTSTSNTTKSEASGNGESTNHKPKDESLVVKIKLNTAAVGGKSSKNGSLPEVVPSSQQQQPPPAPPPVSETLTVKERTGLKIKLTKNHSSKESYSIGNDEAKSKDKPKSSKESRKRSRSSASPKNKEPTHNVIPDVAQPPPAKTLKTISAKSPKKVSVNNNNQTIAAPSPAVSSNPPAQASIAAPVTVEPPLKIPASRKVKSEQPIVLPPQLQQQMQQIQQQMTPTMMTNNNNIDYNRRQQVHDREPQRSRGGKRGRGNNMRMPPGLPPGPPLSLPLPPQQQMMFQGMMPVYDRGGGASDGYAQFYNFGQNNYFGHPMFQDENPMFFNQCGPGPPHAPIMRHPPPHMAFQQSIHQQSRRGGGHYIRPPVLPQRPGSGPPLPSVPPPANPPLPPDINVL